MLEPSCTSYSQSDDELNAELFRSSGDCIKILDLEGQLCRLNPGGIIALELDDPAQLIGLVWWSLWPAQSQHLAERAFVMAKSGNTNQFQALCPTAQDTPRWWDVVSSPMLDHAGNVKAVMIVSRDISELFQARDALKRADQFKDNLLATVAHELRNPISAALTATELLQLKAFDYDSTVKFAAAIKRQLGHMSRIAEDLLDTARIRRGEMSLSKVRVNMKEVVAEALEQLKAAYTVKNHLVSVTTTDDKCFVMGDITRLIQIAGNLIGNAVRYTPANGEIQIGLTRHDGFVELSVTDSGIGIAPEKLSSIFDLYTQGNVSTSNRSDGLGLGLTLTQALVKAHDGVIRAESKGVQMGSQFLIRLPVIT